MPSGLCNLPFAEFYIPGCQGQISQQINQATGGTAGKVVNSALFPTAAGQNAAQALGAGTGGAADNVATAILNAFAQVTGAKSFVDMEQRGLLIGAGIFFVFLGFIVLFFANGGSETVVNLANSSGNGAATPGAGESNAAKLGEVAEVAA